MQRFLKTTGVHYSMHSAGTTLEGSWDQVMTVIGQCHVRLPIPSPTFWSLFVPVVSRKSSSI